MQQAAEIARHLPEHAKRVGVFVDTATDEIAKYVETVKLTAVQFHGNYSLTDLERFDRRQVIAVARVSDTFHTSELEKFNACAAAILLDTHRKGLYGGTGATFDWQTALEAKAYGRIILAGGLNPDNVRKAVETVRPYALDISSGVEAQPGKKDHTKLQQLFDYVREYRQNWENGPFLDFCG